MRNIGTEVGRNRHCLGMQRGKREREREREKESGRENDLTKESGS